MGLFLSLTKANLKRLSKSFPSVIISTLAILTLCSVCGIVLSENLYKKGEREKINVAYYMPESHDDRTALGLDLLQNTDGVSEIVNLVAADSYETGISMLESGDALYFINVPDNFVSDIIDSTNTPLEIIVKDHSSINSYIVNELFLNYASYLGTAQAGVYSALDVMRAEGMAKKKIKAVQTNVNLTYLDRSLNKQQFIKILTATSENSYPLKYHYLACAVMFCLFLSGLVIMPMLHGYNNAMLLKLDIMNIKRPALFIQNMVCSFVCIFVSYIPCHIAISVYTKHVNISILYLIPVALIIAALIAACAIASNNDFTSNMLLFVVVLLIAYVGGCILPSAMLPDVVNKLSEITPGKYIITNLCKCLFGGSYVF